MSTSGPDDRLLGDVVIFEENEATRTGAQSIAPDHVSRSPHREGQLPRRGSAPADLQRRVEEFLFHQSELLDGRHWAAYIELFADDGVYWMPASPEQTEWLDSPSILAEDRRMMEVRAGRITHPNAWSQAAEWGTSHVVGNVVIESAASEAIEVRSRFYAMELRRDATRHFAGRYLHVLIPHGDRFRIRLQRVDLVNAQAPYEYVLLAWL